MEREDAASLPLPLFNIESFPIRTAATTSLSEGGDEVVKFMTARVFPFLRWHLNQRCGKKSNKGNERGPRFLARRCRQILFSKFVKAWHAFKSQCCCSIPKRGEAFFFFYSPPFGIARPPLLIHFSRDCYLGAPFLFLDPRRRRRTGNART